MARFLVVLVALGAVLLGQPGRAAAAAGDVVSRVDAFVREYRQTTGVPGLAVAVTKGDEVLLARGYGHDSTGAPVTASSRFPVGSLSKSVTALAVMQLVENGRVDLDRPVGAYLPEFGMADPRAARITVRQLLNQTSGMSDSTFPDAREEQPSSLRGAVRRLAEVELATDPGSTWRYHNPNWHVAARLVEVVSGQPYAGYLRDHVFGPAGMRHSTSVPTTDAAPAPRGHARRYGAVVASREPHQFVQGSHGVVSTAADMARWLLVQQDGSATGGRLVGDRSLAIMHTPPPGGSDDAMGWFRSEEDGRAKLGHDGAWFTYAARQTLLPQSGYGIAVLANTGIGLTPMDPVRVAGGVEAIVTGGRAEVGTSWSGPVDWVLAGLTLVSLGLGALGVARAGRWARRARRRPVWSTVRLLPYLLPVAALARLPLGVDLVWGGPAISWPQLLTAGLPLVLCVAGAAAACAAVLLARGVRLVTAPRRVARTGDRPAGRTGVPAA